MKIIQKPTKTQLRFEDLKPMDIFMWKETKNVCMKMNGSTYFFFRGGTVNGCDFNDIKLHVIKLEAELHVSECE